MGLCESFETTTPLPTLDLGLTSSASFTRNEKLISSGDKRFNHLASVIKTSDGRSENFIIPGKEASSADIEPVSSKLAEKLAEKTRLNQTPIFKYSGVVLGVESRERNRSVATIHFRVGGRDRYVEKTTKEIGFEVGKNEHVILEGFMKGGRKLLVFRKSVPLDLTAEQWAEMVPFWHVYDESSSKNLK